MESYRDFSENTNLTATGKLIPEACCIKMSEGSNVLKDPSCPISPTTSNSYYLTVNWVYYYLLLLLLLYWPFLYYSVYSKLRVESSNTFNVIVAEDSVHDTDMHSRSIAYFLLDNFLSVTRHWHCVFLIPVRRIHKDIRTNWTNSFVLCVMNIYISLMYNDYFQIDIFQNRQ